MTTSSVEYKERSIYIQKGKLKEGGIIDSKDIDEWLEKDEFPYDGFLRYYIWPDYTELRQIYVPKKNRRKGLGTKMTDRLKKITEELDLPAIYIEGSREHDSDIYRFAVAYGFEAGEDNPPSGDGYFFDMFFFRYEL